MPRKRPPTVEDRLRAQRREAAAVASELARRLADALGGIDAFGPVVVDVFRSKDGQVFSEIDENQGRYEGRDEVWFCLVRQVRNHAEWGPRLFQALRSDEAGEQG